MKGYIFFEELDGNRKSTGNCVALDMARRPTRDKVVGFVAVSHHPNASAVSSTIAPKFLIDYCRRVSEKKARKMHPKLFDRLET